VIDDKMTRKQKLAVFAGPCVLVSMFPVYQALGTWLGPIWGWYAGFLVYWPIWCIAAPLIFLSRRELLALFRRAPVRRTAWVLLLLPPVMAVVSRLVPGGQSHSTVLWLCTAIINGGMEEIFWRGLYVKLFPSSFMFAVIWPSFWFAAWHIASGSLSMPGEIWLLVLGAALLGLVYGWIVYTSRSIRWTVVSHILAGIAQA
jgi:membrane protease YdiL (CAAX protease family)